MSNGTQKQVKCGPECRFFRKDFCTVRAKIVSARALTPCKYYKPKEKGMDA